MFEHVQKCWKTAGFEPIATAVTPNTCIIQDTKDSADLSSAPHGQFEEKEKNFDY